MIDISNTSKTHIILLDTLARRLSTSVIGVSTGAYGAIVHLADGTNGATQSAIEDMLDNIDALIVTADKTTLTEGDADPVITINSADAELGYIVLLDDEEYDAGDVEVIGGTATLNLVSPVAGRYQIFVYRKTDTYESGSVFIIVDEV